MSIIEYYTNVLNSLGMIVSEDGYIYTPCGDDKELIMCNGKPLVLPTKEHLDSIYTKDEDGNYVISKLLFNPLNEDVVKGDSESFKKIKDMVEFKLGHLIFSAGDVLLTLASDKKLQGKTNLTINKFLTTLSGVTKQGVKAIVDDKSLESWVTIYKNAISKQDKAIKIFVKKKGVIDGVNYIRVATLSSNIYEALTSAEEGTSIYGVKLRKKDAQVYIAVFEYLLEGIEEEGIVTYGSNNTEAPAFLALFGLYLTIMDKVNKVFMHLKHVDKKTCELYEIEDLMSDTALNDIEQFKGELLTIPNETDLSRSVTKTNRTTMAEVSMPKQSTSSAYPKEPVNMNTGTSNASSDPLMKALYGNVQQQPMAQPMQQQAIGLNSIPVVQQPIGLNQPMLQPVISNPASYYQPQVQPVGLNSGMGMQQPMGMFGPVGFGN